MSVSEALFGSSVSTKSWGCFLVTAGRSKDKVVSMNMNSGSIDCTNNKFQSTSNDGDDYRNLNFFIRVQTSARS